ncbi:MULTISPECIES: hypothetical protein [unclassified Microbacterium]|uniref:hypothetical protein n=1 Tax=unclassified Microbacterium TaxID=2609290 RepID=UPI00214D01D2|nr:MULTISPECIES: hypothetical protein [unclassified Microbacterium]MCR2784405.1 hypothetical protein [Microbacterium sp. zg.B96]WIM14777.1 hypothetical protein QNO11_09390 [Microbacterium sp. zg-B96]
MTVEAAPVSPRRASPRASAVAAALRELPTRLPVAAAPHTSRLQWRQLAPERYEVTAHDVTIGFIDVVGAVYVALAGSRYSRAVEVSQTLVWTEALSALDAARTTPRTRAARPA